MVEAKTIDTDGVKRLLDEGGSVHVVEVLMPAEYHKGHIPGAIHIHFGMIGRNARDRFLPDDTIITYCHNERCRGSRIAASKLLALGYKNVYHYPGGKDAWTAAGYTLNSSEE